MNIGELIGLGFTKNEATIYHCLVYRGKTDAHQLVHDTKMHKKLVYENLDKLIREGLVSCTVEEGRRVYQLTCADSLVTMFEPQERELQALREKAKKLAQEIETVVPRAPPLQEAKLFRGTQGIRSYYRGIVNTGTEYVVFGAPERSLGIMGEHFWLNFNAKRSEKKIKAKAIFNRSLKDYAKKVENKLTKVRFLSQHFEPLTETNIQADKVAVIVWTQEPVLFLIQDSFVADNYRMFFEQMWKAAKR